MQGRGPCKTEVWYVANDRADLAVSKFGHNNPIKIKPEIARIADPTAEERGAHGRRTTAASLSAALAGPRASHVLEPQRRRTTRSLGVAWDA
jgi:hypothetical protein